MEIAGTTALVTGANRGLGRHLAEQLRDRGATVYAGARNPESVDLSGVIPIALDVTDIESVAAAAAVARDVAILINNAGSSTGSSLLTGDLARHPARNGYPLLRDPERDPGIRAPAGRARPECDPEHPLGALVGDVPADRGLLRRQVGRVGAHQRAAPRARKSGHPGELSPCRLHGHRHGQGGRRAEGRPGGCRQGWRSTGLWRATPKYIADEISKHVLGGLSSGVAGLYPAVA